MDIPVTLNVTNPGPVIEVPVLISATIERSSQYTIQWKVENKGPGPLQWSFANTLPAWLTASKISDTVSGFSFENIELKVDASLIATGVVNYFLEINSNDLLNSKVSTKLHFILITDYPPVVTIPINTQSLKYNAVRISLANRFADPDNDPLVYSATSSDSLVASVDLSGSVLTVNPVSPGTATIEVHATDIFNLSATMTFSVNVSQTVTSIQGTGIEGVPTETGLQASPNPFGTDVTIHYQTENPGHAIVFVSDIVGRIVWQVDGYQEVPGRNEIEIDGRQLAPGMYNCSLLRNGNRIGTVRLVRN